MGAMQFLRLSELFQFGLEGEFRSNLDALLYDLHVRDELNDRNLIIIKYADDYWEYFRFTCEQGIVEVHYSFWVDSPLTFEEINAIDKREQEHYSMARILLIEELEMLTHAVSEYQKKFIT